MAPCDSTLYGNPCCNQVMLVHKQILDKKTGLMKNVDFHQKDRWCKECKDLLVLNWKASECRILPCTTANPSQAVGEEDKKYAAAAQDANKFNGQGVAHDMEGFFEKIPKTHEKIFGTDARVKVINVRILQKKADGKTGKDKDKDGRPAPPGVGLVVLYCGKVPSDCTLAEVPANLCDDSGLFVPLKFAYDSLCLANLHPNKKKKRMLDDLNAMVCEPIPESPGLPMPCDLPMPIPMPEVKPEVKPEIKPEIKLEIKSEIKPEIKLEIKSEMMEPKVDFDDNNSDYNPDEAIKRLKVEHLVKEEEPSPLPTVKPEPKSAQEEEEFFQTLLKIDDLLDMLN